MKMKEKINLKRNSYLSEKNPKKITKNTINTLTAATIFGKLAKNEKLIFLTSEYEIAFKLALWMGTYSTSYIVVDSQRVKPR